MPPRPNEHDETRRGEYRPTLPSIRDLFGPELAQPPRPPRAPLPVGYSPSTHFNQLSLPDDSAPYSGEQHCQSHAPSHTAYAHNQAQTLTHGHAQSRSFMNAQQPSHYLAPGRYPTPTPPSFPPSQSQTVNVPQPARGMTGHGRALSSPDPYAYRPQQSETDAAQWARRGSHRSVPPYTYDPRSSQVQPLPQTAYASSSRAGQAAPYPYAPQVASQRSYGSVHETAADPVQQEQASAPSAKYECSYCGKGFTRPSSLKIHLHSHTGERPYACTFEGCGRTFSVQSNMRRHARTHTQGQAQDSSGEGEDDSGEGSPEIQPRASGAVHAA